jgi:hypothetical protein
MKTVQDSLNDPRMLNDPDMAAALEPVKEIRPAGSRRAKIHFPAFHGGKSSLE